MKKAYLIVLLFCVTSCGRSPGKIDRIIEDGIEVVMNHQEPYQVIGEPCEIILEEELKIDFEGIEFEDSGLKEPDSVDVDNQGNLYVVDRGRIADHFIMKLNQQGKFIKNIGPKGQGPGEIQQITAVQINPHNEIEISDSGNKKIIILDTEGNLLREISCHPQWFNALLLENGNFLALTRKMERNKVSLNLILFNAKHEAIRELDVFRFPHQTPAGKNPMTIWTFYWRSRNGRIYVGNEQRGYEISVYDLEGQLIRKIRKEYNPVKYPDEYTRQTEEIVKNNPDVGPWDFCPPFNSFFIDDENRLFVMTYEQDKSGEQYVHDIFNETGVLIGRKSIGLTYLVTRSLLPRRAVLKNNRYYRLRYKNSGYVELIVYRILWK